MPLPPQVQQALESVIGSIYNLQTSAGGGYKRYYSAIFRDLPDRYEYPDYYVVIKEPRCLHGVLVRRSPMTQTRWQRAGAPLHLGGVWSLPDQGQGMDADLIVTNTTGDHAPRSVH